MNTDQDMYFSHMPEELMHKAKNTKRKRNTNDRHTVRKYSKNKQNQIENQENTNETETVGPGNDQLIY